MNLGSTSLTLFSIPAPSILSFTAIIHIYNFFFLSACLIHMCVHTPTFNFISHRNYIATTMTTKTLLLSFTVISLSKADETDSVSVGWIKEWIVKGLLWAVHGGTAGKNWMNVSLGTSLIRGDLQITKRQNALSGP